MTGPEIIPVTVIVERRASANRWADETWRPVAVVPGREEGPDWAEVEGAADATTYRAGSFDIELHRKDAEAYSHNLDMREPAVSVVLVPADGPVPWRLHLVTLSPYEAESYLVAGDAIVESVPIPEAVATRLRAFADAHHVPEEFRKRKRDRAPTEERQVFGKEPIFAPERGGRHG